MAEIGFSRSISEGVDLGIRRFFSEEDLREAFNPNMDLLETDPSRILMSMESKYRDIPARVGDIVEEVRKADVPEISPQPSQWSDRAIRELSYMVAVGMLSRAYFADGDVEDLTATQIIVALPSFFRFFDGWFR